MTTHKDMKRIARKIIELLVADHVHQTDAIIIIAMVTDIVMKWNGEMTVVDNVGDV